MKHHVAVAGRIYTKILAIEIFMSPAHQVGCLSRRLLGYDKCLLRSCISFVALYSKCSGDVSYIGTFASLTCH